MGLSGRKDKQRIPNDPRNLSWADDASRFGTSYLSKFGWDASKGLGATGEGRLSHIKVTHKLDMMGIGAAHQKDPNGIAWKQNKDFESVLRRLNEGSVEGETAEVTIQGFDRAKGDSHTEDVTKESEGVGEEPTLKKRKRKDKIGEDDNGDEVKREKKKKKKKKTKDAVAENEESTSTTNVVEVPIVVEEIVAPISDITQTSKATRTSSLPRHRAHRARAIAAKNMSSKSASHISEILGIAPTPSSSLSSSLAPTPYSLSSPVSASASGSATPLEETLQLEKITTSSKSVADYFQEKLKLKSRSTSAAPSASDEGARSSSLSMGIDENADDDAVGLRRGIGASLASTAYKKPDPYEDERPRFGLGSSRLRFELTGQQVLSLGAEAEKSQFSKTSIFLASAMSTTATTPDLELNDISRSEGETDLKVVDRIRRKDKERKKSSSGKRREAEVADCDARKSTGDRKKKDKRRKANVEQDVEGTTDKLAPSASNDEAEGIQREKTRRRDETRQHKKGQAVSEDADAQDNCESRAYHDVGSNGTSVLREGKTRKEKKKKSKVGEERTHSDEGKETEE